MGIKHEEAHGSLQFSMGRWTAGADVDHVLEVLPGVVKRLRDMSALKPGMEYDKEGFGKHGHEE
jgi:cysteine desulfurase